jgi:hypothetical protein
MTRRLLVAYSAAAQCAQTTIDYVSAFGAYLSDWDVFYLNVGDGATTDIDLSDYDAVLQSYCARLCYPGYVSSNYLAQLKVFRGLKIIAVQDEYERTNATRDAIAELGYHVVLTCLSPEDARYAYGDDLTTKARFHRVLTGYLPETQIPRGMSTAPIAGRPIGIGYRARDLGPRYGRLGFEKREIGVRFKAACEARDIVHDISLDEAARLDGLAWSGFIARCRAMLGTESGSNLFDFDGELEARTKLESSAKEHPTIHDWREVVADREAPTDVAQISPRVFECAVLGTVLILLEGRYSGILQPGTHYLSVAKDFSNIDGILDALNDVSAMQAMVQRVRRDLVDSGAYSHAAFAKEVATLAQEEIARRKLPPAISVPALETCSTPGEREAVTRMPKSRAQYDLAQADRASDFLRSQIGDLRKDKARIEASFGAHVAQLEATIAALTEAQSGIVSRAARMLEQKMRRLKIYK